MRRGPSAGVKCSAARLFMSCQLNTGDGEAKPGCAAGGNEEDGPPRPRPWRGPSDGEEASMSDEILSAQDGGILRVTINRPEAGNAMTDAMAQELTRIIA